MDGIHDLGGRQGFGLVDVDEPEEAFHEVWEGRVWGIARAMTRLPDWNLDWFRHCRELIDPVDYLTRPYFDQWVQTYAAMLVNSGAATVEEVASGRSQSIVPGLKPPMPSEAVQQAKSMLVRFDREGTAEPALAVGDVIRAKAHGVTGHTRLPAYVRGRRGVIEACHGAHVLPDAKAHGDDRAEPLYTVAFEAAELWSDAAGRRDRVFVDLWEAILSALEVPEIKPLARRDGEPAFGEAWQAELLALAYALTEAGVFSSTEWSEALGAELQQASARGEPDDQDTYYGAALATLERLIEKDGRITVEALASRTEQWRRAYLNTPHGKPVELSAV